MGMGTTGNPLERRPLGATGLLVSPLCLGCGPLGDMPENYAYGVGEERALATIRACLESPINFLDTAASYGEAERRIGVALRERGGDVPAGFVLATKADRDFQTGDFSGDQMRRSVERSLQRLGLERLQLVYLHDPEHTTFEASMAPGGAVPELVRCQEEGLIEHLGVAGGPIPMSIRYVETGIFAAAITHNRYTLLNTSAEPLLEVCARRGVALLNAAPYGSGVLAKGLSAYPRYAYQEVSGDLRDRVGRLEAICARHGVPLGAAALQYSLRDSRIASTIVGMSRSERLTQTLALAQHPIPNALWEEVATVPPTREDPEEHRWSG